ncbi:MAG: rRNA maturation RNase YbeY [Cycloclasticus sp.]|jgi:probable rRNA maturation factor|nr:MAG: rRNA maturation RNase YbeY [Cycloclasticus sp. Phe_18]MBV1912716.1 rRNA maturation RNase YbeY [Cycloclasticus sp.]MDF1689793.1 rRNA maturation RNase YbeY [Cycloclasticus sp.]MEE4290934.1 rRNA maturation RNase YbeY [Cycloclasticus sp.]
MTVDVQVATDCSELPDTQIVTDWVELATKQREHAEVVVRLVGEQESAELNEAYRQKKGPTNVLSFPFERPEGLPVDALLNDTLGDLVICAPVVLSEAADQGKTPLTHWAHMVIHGCLHLQGYDHVNAKDAQVMEALEIKLLEQIGISNPYEG